MTNSSFQYKEKFDEVAPNCKSNFQRTLQHKDWVDGKSVVKAEKSATDEGFNARFHKIQADFDALGMDSNQAFLCIAEMRQSLFNLLEEIRTEFNWIRGIADLAGKQAAQELGNQRNQLVNDAFQELVNSGYNPPSQSAINACMRDLGIFLDAIIESCNLLSYEPIDYVYSQSRETFPALGIESVLPQTALQHMKDNHNLGIETARIANHYFDYAIQKFD
ncbi:phycobilisome protein [Leptolyngbya sp. Heron Island J]|uniref:phycobilisome protein n=1 Tax=Leptolyngbya sp. Heron Island J TaxID=1385935 RepID=UPI0003B9759E|nr:phycobilisome protein [Leptolyngbya sp. Heron Island J]ESA32878.1 phycobilisome protein [Leptolyngbya sp. Heron Island J]